MTISPAEFALFLGHVRHRTCNTSSFARLQAGAERFSQAVHLRLCCRTLLMVPSIDGHCQLTSSISSKAQFTVRGIHACGMFLTLDLCSHDQ